MRRTVCVLLSVLILAGLCGCCRNHDFSEATCTEPSKCTLCGEIQGEPLGHSTVPYEKEPTCTEDGFRGGKKCERCGEIIESAETVPALGHEPESDAAVPASHESSGLTEGSHCARCGEVLSPQEEIVLTEEEQLFADACFAYLNNDFETSFAMLSDCKDSDSPLLRALLGAHQFFGCGTSVSNPSAFKSFTAASENGSAYATWLLGNCFQWGYGTKKNGELSTDYYVRGLAEMEEEYASCSILEERLLLDGCLGNIYMVGYDGVVKRDTEKGYSFYLDGEQHGDWKCILSAGVCSFLGKGTEQDYELAFRRFKTVDEMGVDFNAPAMLRLMYRYGLGCEADEEKSEEMRLRAKELGAPSKVVSENSIYYLFFSNKYKTLAYAPYTG